MTADFYCHESAFLGLNLAVSKCGSREAGPEPVTLHVVCIPVGAPCRRAGAWMSAELFDSIEHVELRN